MSDNIIKLLLGIYIIISIVCLYEKNYAKFLYWVGASIINLSILWGFK